MSACQDEDKKQAAAVVVVVCGGMRMTKCRRPSEWRIRNYIQLSVRGILACLKTETPGHRQYSIDSHALNTAATGMDDVWTNAWSQPEEDVAHNVPTKPKLHGVPPWSFPSSAAGKEEEADVGMPSWSTGELNWTEPTGQASLWSSTSVVDDIALSMDGWRTSSDMKPESARNDEHTETVGSADSVGNEESSNATPSAEEQELRSETPDSLETATLPVHSEPSPSVTEKSPIVPQSDLPVSEVLDNSDNFGSFVDGLASVSTSFDESNVTWGSPAPTFNDPDATHDAWGSAWNTPDLGDTQEEEPKDEWAIASEQKAKRDRTVPPELLATIMDQLNELSEVLWHENERPNFAVDFGNWRDGISNVDGLQVSIFLSGELLLRTLPDARIQPPIQVSGSHTTKSMAKSLKLSKNLPVVRSSPMSHLFTTKSLAAWELSVKSKVEVPKDDIPAGWRIVAIEEDQDLKPTQVEKKSAGILSFFSRKASTAQAQTPTTNGIDSKRSSLSREVSSETASGPAASRNSSDTNSLSSRMQHSSSVSSLPSVASTTLPSSPGGSSSMPPPSSPAPSSSQPPESPTEPVASPAPSVVSRFFNRFSRTKTNSGSTSPRSSLALSTDDLEFLSDIVPGHTDGADEDRQLSALSAFVSAPALPSKLPPPLAPPPTSSASQSGTPPPSLPPQKPLLSAARPNVFGDLESLVPQLPPKGSGRDSPANAESNARALPPPLFPPLSPSTATSFSKPPTPSPLSGVVRSTPSRASSVSTPSRITSPVHLDPPIKALSAHNTGSGPRSFSPLSTGIIGSGSSFVGTAGGLPYSQSHYQPTSSVQSPIPPPPIEKSPNRSFALSDAHSVVDDDDFSDFQSHTASSMRLAQPSRSEPLSFEMSFDSPSDQSMLPEQEAPDDDDSFGDFSDFVHSSAPTSMPRPLSKPEPPSPLSPPVEPIGVCPPLPKKQVPANLNTQHLRKPSAADHEAASRLVERAAARPGRWPAPPSPIPEPLSPPPSGGTVSRSSTSSHSLLDLDNDRVKPKPPVTQARSITLKPIAQITSLTKSGREGGASPPLLPPPRSISNGKSVAEASLLDLGDSPKPVKSHTPSAQGARPSSFLEEKPKALSTRPGQGGLSAQDLSFFEGL
ncbi:uncharacterized protein FOMMEDRAFT_143962 [Fomitiporia mediterranea MF3/22]|uniref:uncharacterized protein n=1 Tax=Fomitiporia mediterranea (strain MF3/22) TaxID=694068 RepID=UPI0004407B8F|nr:uncharacterized protein FOMMEDRAFT_143962 [Fomitiporia mediterranea MF3/22]EJD07640.1 hypothetical protein FOMMEDRAFT_143962 [Fomitiporia mediterranea MF3/22]